MHTYQYPPNKQTEPSLWSIGRLADRLQVNPREIITAAKEQNIRPVFWLDGVPYWAEESEPRIREAIKNA